MAWQRKILRVNLTEGSCTSEPVNMAWAADYLGGRGLGSKYLVSEVDPGVDPFSPDNKLIMATGPLTGTPASTGSRYVVITKSPLTGTIACSNSGGFFGAELKFSGWDMIIFEGRAKSPVYLHIENDQATLESADDIWGKSTWETEGWIKKRHQDPQLRIASIGPAGENRVLFACVVNDLHRAAGRSGVGAVMGSKNLKAVAVRGTLGLDTIKDMPRFMDVVGQGKVALAENAVTGKGLPTYGTQVLMNVINEVGALPTRNHRQVQFEHADQVSGEAMHEPRKRDGKPNLIANAACFGCTIACGRISKVDKDHFSVKTKPEFWGASGGLEYESAWALLPNTGVSDLEAGTYVNSLCNYYGMDPISFGVTVSAAMELFEVGAISEANTGGIKLGFGSAEALVAMAELTGKGEGFGRELGMGSKRLCARYGRPELSMSVKGQEFPAYDGRSLQGIGLNYATSNRGACHVRGYTVASEVLGIPVKTDPNATEGKAGLVKAFQDITATWDSTGLCLFTSFAWGMPEVSMQLDAALEGQWPVERLMEIGERIYNMERDFNLRAGLTGKDDTLPDRILHEPATSGPAKGMVNRLGEMLPEYYRLRGWSEDGVPTGETRQRLGL
ncbi:MAG: aldehyde ferredoxin oxidoreductase [Magnetococcales bacterium]|nr:aldehyde ferredoxin oxidoreductase [Magnetococcales bacterium]